MPASVLATGLIVFAWAYFILTNSVATIWPMFGLANQLLALIALAIVTSALANAGRFRYSAVTLLPMAFVACTTLSAAYLEMKNTYWPLTQSDVPGQALKGWLNFGLTAFLLLCVAVIVVEAARRWFSVVRSGSEAEPVGAARS
jgi:carbon starvation protein